MASFSHTFTYKPLQLHLSSFSYCNFPSSLNNTSLSHDSSPSKLQLITHANVRLAACSNTALSGEMSERISTNAINSTSNADFLSGFSPFSDSSKRAGRKSPETDHNHAEKPAERRVILKDRYSKAGSNSKTRKDVGRFNKSEKPVRSTEKMKTLRESKEGAGKNGDNVEQKGRRIKKSQDDPERNMLRIGMDSCSKRGDIVCAIKLYDLARKEGIKIEQYHYAVLLYLCSSAAAGVVQPAKSGSRTQTLSSGDQSSGSESSSDIVEMMNCGNFSLIDGEEGLSSYGNGSLDISGLSLDSLVQSMKKAAENSNGKNERSRSDGIQVSKEMKRVALKKGYEIYKEIGLEKVPMNEATFTSVARMAMALGDGEMAFDTVKQMKEYVINPRL